jgi:GTPase SAR1 family protein
MIELQPQEIDLPSELKIFQRNRQSLSRLTARLSVVFEQLGIGSRAKALAALRERIDSDRFKVMVLGEFKRGKSTFINALLGEEVLPSSAVPCTAVINEIKWGEARRAVLHFRVPLPDAPQAAVPSAIQAHIRRAGKGPVPPIEVPIDRLDDYVAIPDPGKDQADSVAESPYALIEVFWPLDLCGNGIEIIDSPGLNENATRARVAKEYVANVDAILFVMSCSAFGSDSEMRVINNDLRGVGHDYLFFICNRFDEIRESDRQRVKDYARKKLAGCTALENGLFFLSAWDALQARLRSDPALLESSGMAELEKALRRFLSQEKGKVKLLQPARELLGALKEARDKIIPDQRHLLDESLSSLEAKIEKVRPQLADAERSKNQIIANINFHRQALRSEVRLESEKFLRNVADQLEGWVMALQLENGVKLFSFKHKEQVEALAKEASTKVGLRFEKEAVAWSSKVLEPLINAKIEAMMVDANVQVTNFTAKIDQIRSTFIQVRLGANDEIKEPSAGERALAAAVGFLTSDIVSVAHGARFGFKGLGTNILTQLATYGILVSFLGVTNPIILIAALLGMGALVGGMRIGSLNDKAKKEIARSMGEQFRAELTNTAQKIADEVYSQTEEFVSTAEKGLEREIKTIREQMDIVLRDKKAGEVQVQSKKRLLSELEVELRDIGGLLDDLILSVAGDGKVPFSLAEKGGKS